MSRLSQKHHVQRKLACSGRARVLILTISLLLVSQLLVTCVQAMYLRSPYQALNQDGLSRRQDSDDEEEMDSNASAPYQNQDEGNRGSDGYEDPEADGPYGETPRDEEGQADLERFFDDHLGASERDGMDKENLPTNLAPVVLLQGYPGSRALAKPLDERSAQPVMVPYVRANPDTQQQQQTQHLEQQSMTDNINDHLQHPRIEDKRTTANYNQGPDRQVSNKYDSSMAAALTAPSAPEPTSSYPRIETSYVRLPDNKLIITRHITRDLLRKPEFVPAQEQDQEQDRLRIRDNDDDAADLSSLPSFRSSRHRGERKSQTPVVKLEDDDMDPVYVTNVTNKPFRIAALGGYDPEEDFRDASIDISDNEAGDGHQGGRSASSRRSQRRPVESVSNGGGINSDISFGDPETDAMFNEASETDEVTFHSDDDPYQTDLEAELHAQAYDQPGQVTQNSASDRSDDGDEPEVEIKPARLRERKRLDKIGAMERSKPRNSYVRANRRRDDLEEDDSEGSWLNDGVDDMEIPSRSRQESVLNKAALAAEAANQDRTTDGEGEPGQDRSTQEPQSINQPDDQGDQRMPNADYMKEDMKVDDIDYKA